MDSTPTATMALSPVQIASMRIYDKILEKRRSEAFPAESIVSLPTRSLDGASILSSRPDTQGSYSPLRSISEPPRSGGDGEIEYLKAEDHNEILEAAAKNPRELFRPSIDAILASNRDSSPDIECARHPEPTR